MPLGEAAPLDLPFTYEVENILIKVARYKIYLTYQNHHTCVASHPSTFDHYQSPSKLKWSFGMILVLVIGNITVLRSSTHLCPGITDWSLLPSHDHKLYNAGTMWFLNSFVRLEQYHVEKIRGNFFASFFLSALKFISYRSQSWPSLQEWVIQSSGGPTWPFSTR